MDRNQPESPRTVALVALAVAPALIMLAVSVWTVFGWLVGIAPLWPEPNQTLSEAAALKNSGEVVRLITRDRVDPNRVWPMREGISNAAPNMTALEAAVRDRRVEMVTVLLQHGAQPPDAAARAELICLAVQSGAPEIADALLQTGDRSDPRTGCSR
jgi:hypothetical protein